MFDDLGVNEVEDFVAVFVKLSLDIGLVSSDTILEVKIKEK